MKFRASLFSSLLGIALVVILYFSLREGDAAVSSLANEGAAAPQKVHAPESVPSSAVEEELWRLREENERLKKALSEAVATHPDTPTS